ncbi:KilA-N domain-containing protein [Asaia astilbis]
METARPVDTTRANSFTTVPHSLTILSTGIRRDNEGRYCLNDCHKASGGDASKAPGQWMANKQTKALIAEIETVEIPTVSETAGKSVATLEGRNGGTYVAKELVYAYAMWISPLFHLKVIRAFDALVQGNTHQPATVIPPEAVTLYQTLTNVGMTAHGMTRKRAVTFANEAVAERYGIDFMGMMGIPKVGVSGRKRIERPTAEEANPKFPEVLANLAAVFGVGKRPFSTAEIMAHPRACGDIARVLGYHVCDADGEISSRRLGRYLLAHSGEQVAGACVAPYGYTRDKVRLWAIDPIAQGGVQ